MENQTSHQPICCCENETTDQAKLDQIGKIIEDYDSKRSSLIQILHAAQGIYGYLPLEVQRYIAEKLGMPLSEVYGVVTFYSFFSTQPKGKYTLGVCLGTACYVRGGKKIVDKLRDILKIEPGETTPDRKFSLEVMRCIGACGLAPAMTVNGEVYKQVNPDKLKTLLAQFD